MSSSRFDSISGPCAPRANRIGSPSRPSKPGARRPASCANRIASSSRRGRPGARPFASRSNRIASPSRLGSPKREAFCLALEAGSCTSRGFLPRARTGLPRRRGLAAPATRLFAARLRQGAARVEAFCLVRGASRPQQSILLVHSGRYRPNSGRTAPPAICRACACCFMEPDLPPTPAASGWRTILRARCAGPARAGGRRA
jgi:hypothetical protein